LILDDEKSDNDLRQRWPTFNQDEIQVFHLMFKYLKQFSLEDLLAKSKFQTSLPLTRSLRLPPMTLKNLELTSTSRGSLLTILNSAKTKPGRRLFKDWLLNPLTDEAEINSRFAL
jgi:DNA mismatch repair ATPase MutS